MAPGARRSTTKEPTMIDSSTTDLCHCGKPGLFGYKDESGKMVWYCGEHRLAQHWADARRDVLGRGEPG